MLTHLYITNYAIIDELEVNFNKGFTVITGETGAGKSILLGALSLILGKRVDNSVLNDATRKCVIEGCFKINEPKFESFFKINDLDFDNETIIRREISSTGKSRAFINDTPVNLAVLKDLTELLVDIHSQHQTLQVKDTNFQINVVDSFIEINKEVNNYKNDYKTYLSSKRKLEKLIDQEKTAKSDVDYIEFQVKEIQALDLKENEQALIEEQLEIINNAEEIKQVLHFASETFSNTENNNIVGNIKSIQHSFNKISHCSEDYKTIAERLNTILIEVSDLAREIELINDNADFDIENANYLNERLNAIYSLEKKHHLNNSDELLSFLSELEDKLLKINSFDDDIELLKTELKTHENKLLKQAKVISSKRVESFQKLAKNIKTNLSELGMPEASFEIKHKISSQLNENGIDELSFLFSANRGFDPIELYKAASGGELSRLMLTIKSILNKSNEVSIILFDEIDTGVSGDIADKMGEIMKEMSKSIQVITITHLPQVAAKGDTHFKIFKTVNKSKTATSLTVLSKEERVDELAKMLSGKELTEAARENAKNLISN